MQDIINDSIANNATASGGSFCGGPRRRAVLCAGILLLCLLLKYLLWDFWDNPFTAVVILILAIPLGVAILVGGVYLLLQPIKAACRWKRAKDGGGTFVWTLVPWMALVFFFAADKLCYRGYLAWRRPAVLRQIQTGVLKADDGASTGDMKMHPIDHWTSVDGTVHVFQNKQDKLIVGFWLRRGMLSASTYQIYTSGDSQPTPEELCELPCDILSAEKKAPHLYEMTIDY